MIKMLFSLALSFFIGTAALAQSTPSGGVTYGQQAPSLNGVTKNGNYLAKLSFMAWCAKTGVVCTTGDQAQNIQKFLLAANLLRYQLIGPGFHDFFSSPSGAGQFVEAFIEPYIRKIATTVAVPSGVYLNAPAGLYRDSTVGVTGTCTLTWWDGSNCGDLAVLTEPMLISTINSKVNAYLYAKNGDGTNKGSGHSRRVWEIGNIVSVGAGGSGYNVAGEIGTLANPELKAAGATVTLTVNGSGAVTNAVLTSGVRFAGANGIYLLPPVLQNTQYADPNFIAATGVQTFINDGSGTPCYAITAPSGGTGACAHVAWYPDWTTGTGGGTGNSAYVGGSLSTNYEGQYGGGGFAEVQGIDNINVYDAGIANDSTQYGPMFSTLNALQNSVTNGQTATQGGYYGIMHSGIDYRANILNPVQMPIGLWMKNGQQHVNMAIIDSPTVSGAQIGGGSTSGGGLAQSVNYMEVFRNSGASAISGYCLDLGTLGGASNLMTGLSIGNVTCTNLGGTGSIYADYLGSGNDINAVVSNISPTGAANTNPQTTFVTFGTHNHAGGGNLFRGIMDGAAGNIVSGTIPSGTGLHVWDAYAGGFDEGPGAYRIWGGGPPTNGGSGTGVNKAGPGSFYIDTTNGDVYIGQAAASSPVWTRFNAPSMPKWRAGHYYTIQGNTLSTTTTGTTGGNMIVSMIPVYVPNPITPANLAFEITTPQTTGFSARLAVYADATLGSAAPVIDGGTMSIGASVTGVQIQGSGSWTTGAGTTLQPGTYWLFSEIVPITGEQVRSTNFGSPGPEGTAGLGYVLVGGSALPAGPVVAKGIGGLGTSIVTPPSSFTATDAVSGANPINVPIVWLGM